MNTSRDLDLLLIGKTGNGKSATGNSILGNKVFKSMGMASSVTKKIKHGYGKHKGRHIHVVDSPGVGETRLDSAKATLKVSKALRKAILINHRGYHAFLILLKFGNRFTGEEQDAIKFLKDTFGVNFVRDFCILVMCGGDNFKRECEDSIDMTFEKWVKEQQGQMKDLIEECAGRILLFDNVTKDEQEKKEQLDQLIELVDNLNAKGERYTDKHFQEAKETRDKILAEANETIISEEIVKEMNLIFQKLKKIQSNRYIKPANEKLEKLKKRCQYVINEIKTKPTTSAMTSLLDSVNSLNRIIDFEIKFYVKIEKKITENTKDKEILKKRHEDEIEQLYIEFSKNLYEKTQGVGKRPEMKEIFKKEIEDYKRKLQLGCATQSVKQIIERMELNFRGDKLGSNEEACSPKQETVSKKHIGFTGESSIEKIKSNESNTPFGDIQKLMITKEESIETQKQSSLQQIQMECKKKTEPTMRGMVNKDDIFKSHLENVLSRQVQEVSKIEKETLNKEEVAESEDLIKEALLAEDMYRAAEDESNRSFFSRMKSWIKSLFRK